VQLQYNIRLFQGHRIFASRKVAEKIEIQTRYAAELYNVDVRQDQRYLFTKKDGKTKSKCVEKNLPAGASA
jgi:hypothetical protein